MRKLGFLVAGLFLLASLLGACEPKSSRKAQKPTEKEQVVDEGPFARQAKAQALAKSGVDGGSDNPAQPAADGAAASPGVLPSPTDFKDPNEYARAVSQFAQEINTDEAPEYVTKMLGHMEKITHLMQKNLSDCEQLVSVVSAYMTENKNELEDLRKKGDEAQAKMSPEEKARISAMTLMLMSSFAKDLANVQMQFVKLCPKQADSLADVMQNLGD